MRVGSGLQPLRMAPSDPIQHAGSPRPQQRYVIREKRQTERKHPDAEDRQQRQDPPDDQQESRWNSEPAPGWLAEAPYGGTKALRQPLDQRVQAPIITRISMGPNFRLRRK